MPFQYLTGSVLISADGADAVTVASDDYVIVAQGAVRAATGNMIGVSFDGACAIYGGTSALTVTLVILGDVVGNFAGIQLDAVGGVKTINIGATGRVLSAEVGVLAHGSRLDLSNQGSIFSDGSGVVARTSFSDILNTGTIVGTSNAIFIESGTSSQVVNTGTLRGGYSFYSQGLGDDSVWNLGTMVGSIVLGSGDDLYQGRGSLVDGSIEGGAGNDTINGGDDDDLITDGSGRDWLAGGNGADTIVIGVQASGATLAHIFGGVMGGADTSTNDTLDVYDGGAGAVNILLGSGILSRVATGDVLAWFTGIENANGTNEADAIIGSAGANVIEGAGGGDWMVGNGGADRFVFSSVSHADPGDQIRDFRRSEGDRIDLSGVDAISAVAGNDSFVFRTTHTNNGAGELVVTNFGNSARVDLYTNADNVVDGTFIVVYGEAGVTNLTASDFIL